MTSRYHQQEKTKEKWRTEPLWSPEPQPLWALNPAHQPGIPLLTLSLLFHQLTTQVRVVSLGQAEALHLSPLGSTSY